MRMTETVHGDGQILGRVTYDSNEGIATFAPYLDALKPLKSKRWHCPVECREAVIKTHKEQMK
jgi:hypothetical protein